MKTSPAYCRLTPAELDALRALARSRSVAEQRTVTVAALVREAVLAMLAAVRP